MQVDCVVSERIVPGCMKRMQQKQEQHSCFFPFDISHAGGRVSGGVKDIHKNNDAIK